MKLFYIQRPVAVTMLTLGVVIFGAISLFRLPQALLPELVEPTLTVETKLPDAAPKEVERLITVEIERALGTLGGLKDIESYSQPATSIVKLRFGWGHDVNRAIQEIREALDKLRLPDNAEKPRVLRFDPSMEPIARLSFRSYTKSSLYVRDVLATNIKPVIETIPGIATSIIKGGREEEIAILFDQGRLEPMGLAPADIIDALRSENISMPTGKFEVGDQELFVRVKSEFESTRDIEQLVLRQNGANILRLGDVASVQRRLREPETMTRQEAEEAVFLDVYKEADANIIAVVDALRANVEEKLKSFRWMDGIDVEIVGDESVFIRKAVRHVIDAGIAGAGLAMLVLYLFLGSVRPSVLIGLTIPISVTVTFFLMDQSGMTMNIMSLGGLALGIGMLVDNSIVVLENIAKQSEKGLTHLDAAVKGTAEVMTPVTASTLTTVAVFAPLVFVEGIAGQLFGDLAWTIIYSLLSSLAVAVVVLPTFYVLAQKTRVTDLPTVDDQIFAGSYLPFLSTAWNWRQGRVFVWSKRYFYLINLLQLMALPWWILRLVFAIAGDLLRLIAVIVTSVVRYVLHLLILTFTFVGWPVRKFCQIFMRLVTDWEQRRYPRFLLGALRQRAGVIVGILVMSILAVVLASRLGGDLLPPLSQSSYIVEGELPLGSSIRRTSSTSLAMENLVRGQPGVERVVALVGIDEAQALLGNAGIHKFQIRFEVDPKAFSRPSLEESLNTLQGVKWKLNQPSLAVQIYPIEVVVSDPDLDRLRSIAGEVDAGLQRLSFLQPAYSTMGDGVPELSLVVKEDALLPLGLSPREVTDAVSNYLLGVEATTFEEGAKSIPVIVKAQERDLRGEADLRGIKLLMSNGMAVDLGTVVEVRREIGPSFIYRVGGNRSVRLAYRIQDIDLDAAKARVEALLPANTTSTEFQLTGQTEEYQRSTRSLLFAILLSIFMVYLVMASQFESITQPLFVMGVIPLAFIGVVFALYPLGVPLNVMALVGCVVLVGVIVNNAIVYVDKVNLLHREDGLPYEQALMAAGTARLRPILMTTVTTVLGLVPMAVGSGEGSALARSMAITIIAGLSVGTVLTLIILPVLLRTFAKTKEGMKVGSTPQESYL